MLLLLAVEFTQSGKMLCSAVSVLDIRTQTKVFYIIKYKKKKYDDNEKTKKVNIIHLENHTENDAQSNYFPNYTFLIKVIVQRSNFTPTCHAD